MGTDDMTTTVQTVRELVEELEMIRARIATVGFALESESPDTDTLAYVVQGLTEDLSRAISALAESPIVQLPGPPDEDDDLDDSSEGNLDDDDDAEDDLLDDDN